MEKSPDAFRTISEVAEWLDVPTHVLRFWESRFAQVKPVKRAGGRRYYRPADMRLIGGIKRLLHDDGMTIRGVQRLLREEGVKHVQGFSQPLEHEQEPSLDLASGAARPALARDRDAALPFIPSGRAPAPAPEEAADAEWSQDGAAAEAETGDPQPVAFGSVRGPAPEPAGETAPPRPIVANVPETDPEDDAPGHTRPPGAAARLLLLDRAMLVRDGIRIEQVVAALRAVRDRSAS